MYKGKDKRTLPLFKELFPFGGKLDENNRWLRIAGLIPWEKIEEGYRKHFAAIGRPALDLRLVIGILLLKHMTGLSDEEMVLQLRENPYMQAFCGFDHFQTAEILDSSPAGAGSKLSQRLGAEYFAELEKLTYDVLVEKKIIKAKGLLVDATVFPEKIEYPTDVGLLNVAREWLVKRIKDIGGQVGLKSRTYTHLGGYLLPSVFHYVILIFWRVNIKNRFIVYCLRVSLKTPLNQVELDLSC